MKNHTIPSPAVQRLSLYLRRLEQLDVEGAQTISSHRLARDLHITAAQLRKDLAYFGQFGRPGVGYRVRPLIDELRHILGTDRTWPVVVVGVGDLGRALLRYRGFHRKGFEFVAAFDIAPGKVGKRFGPIIVQHLDELPQVVSEYRVRLGVIATPPESAQAVAELLGRCGVQGILNFAPVTLQMPPDVSVAPVDLAASLEQLAFQVLSTE